MVSETLKRLQWERKLREREELAAQQSSRVAEVQAAFFEGMLAGYDRSWMERPPEDYWLESDARKNLYLGPPVPIDPMVRLRAGRHRRGYSYDPQRDPGRVIGKSFMADMPRAKKGRSKKK